MTVSALRCPLCGSSGVLVFTAVPLVVHTLGTAGWHLSEPWGDFANYPVQSLAMAECNALPCDWSGTVAEAIPET